MRNEGGELAKLCGGCWTTKTTTTTDAISWRNRSSINGIQQLRHWKQLTNKKLLADNDEDDTTTDRNLTTLFSPLRSIIENIDTKMYLHGF